MLESKVLWGFSRNSWLLGVCGVHWRFAVALYRVKARWKLEDLGSRESQRPEDPGQVCQILHGLLFPFLSPVRWGGWPVNPLETSPLLCNLVETAGQHCHLSEEERMWIYFCKKLRSFQRLPCQFPPGAEEGLVCLSRIWWCTLRSRVAKQTHQTNASFSRSAKEDAIYSVPVSVGWRSLGVSRVDPADLDPGALRIPIAASRWFWFWFWFFTWTGFRVTGRVALGKDLRAARGRCNPLPLIDRGAGSGNGHSRFVSRDAKGWEISWKIQKKTSQM